MFWQMVAEDIHLFNICLAQNNKSSYARWAVVL